VASQDALRPAREVEAIQGPRHGQALQRLAGEGDGGGVDAV